MPKKEKIMTIWYPNFLGIRYVLKNKSWHVVPIFTNSQNAKEIWEKEIDPHDEKTLKMRFIEHNNGEYKFILYPSPFQQRKPNFGLYRSMRTSEIYNLFKKNFDGKACFTFGLIGDSPFTFSKSKLVTDIKFMKDSEVPKNSPEWLAEVYQRHARATYG